MSTGKKLAKTAAAAALAFVVAFSAPAGTAAPALAVSLSELQENQSSLEEQGNEMDAQLEELKNNMAQQQEYKDTLDARIVNLEKQIDSMNAEIDSLDTQIAEEEQTITSKQAEIDEDFTKLKQRVYALYLTGEASSLEILLNAKSIMDLSDKAEILKMVSEHDTALINTLKDDLTAVETAKESLETNRASITEEKAELVENEQQIQTLSDEAAQVMASLSSSEQQLESEQAQNRIDQDAAAEAVNAWLASYYSSQSGSQSSSAAALSYGDVETVLSVARQYLGCPYRWGACGPSSFDCSGFVSYVLKQSGWSLNGATRMGVDGLWSYCTPISYSQAAPGDLVFYDYTYGGLPNSHVGIYLGNGIAIQCDDYGGVEYVSLSASYWSSHLGGFGRLPS